jgi:membrane associated rhomboid family serine protease
MTDEPKPTARQPAFNLPGVVLACCLGLIGIHALRMLLSLETDERMLALLAFVPARTAIALGVATSALQQSVQNIPQETFVALIGDGGGRWWTFVTYALLHGSWAHVGFNCVWLAAFGAPVARRIGAARFLALFVVSAVIGALVQFVAAPASFVPVIGASAAVAGAMGAATRFVFRPTDEASAAFDEEARRAATRRPALSLRQIVTTRAALAFVVVWFVSNLLFGFVPALGGVGGPIAWQAHIGGFLAGLLLFPLLDPAPPVSARDAEISAEVPLGPAG